MNLCFNNLLYSAQSLKKPAEAITDSRRTSFPGEDALRVIPGFDEHYIIRYNSQGGYAYGGISANDIGKTILAITRVEDGKGYCYNTLSSGDAKKVGKSWSCGKDDGFRALDLKVLISDIMQQLNNGETLT